MQRTLNVATDVFAAVWANRLEGEETEDAILRRMLKLKANGTAPLTGLPGKLGGVRDHRNGVDFPEGFEIFRSYKRREYNAVATSGNWLRKDTGELYATLNQLNASIALGAENVWNGNWKFRNVDGNTKSIGALRR